MTGQYDELQPSLFGQGSRAPGGSRSHTDAMAAPINYIGIFLYTEVAVVATSSSKSDNESERREVNVTCFRDVLSRDTVTNINGTPR